MTQIRGIDLRTEPDFVERYERILAGDTAWGPEKREQYLKRNYQKYKEVKRDSELWKGDVE